MLCNNVIIADDCGSLRLEGHLYSQFRVFVGRLKANKHHLDVGGTILMLATKLRSVLIL